MNVWIFVLPSSGVFWKKKDDDRATADFGLFSGTADLQRRSHKQEHWILHEGTHPLHYHSEHQSVQRVPLPTLKLCADAVPAAYLPQFAAASAGGGRGVIVLAEHRAHSRGVSRICCPNMVARCVFWE